jgi:hypothetical protein
VANDALVNDDRQERLIRGDGMRAGGVEGSRPSMRQAGGDDETMTVKTLSFASWTS